MNIIICSDNEEFKKALKKYPGAEFQYDGILHWVYVKDEIEENNLELSFVC